MGKEFAIIAELYPDYCQNVYGVAPCTASIPLTGTQKCFNTYSTCQDVANYNRGTKVYRFSSTRLDDVQQAGEIATIPTIRSIDTAPTKLDPGRGIGIRSSVNLSLDDHPWTDAGTDPYRSERTYDPDSRGSFWGRFIARNPNYEGRRIDILTGYLDESGAYIAENFRRRTYELAKISGPDSDGKVTIEAKDPLRGADLSKAQWPVASSAKLVANIATGDTAFSIGDASGQVLAAFAAGQEYIRIDDEIMRLTSVVSASAGFYDVIVSRTDSPSIFDNSLNVQVAHSLGALVQPCWYFLDQRIDQVLLTLLSDGASIDSAYLPAAEWATAVLDGGLDNYLFTTLITEPTGVGDLLTEISQHGALIWWDEREQKVLIKSTIAFAFSTDPLNEDDDIVAGSISITRDVKNRISQAWVFFGLRFPTLDLKKLVSYSAAEIKVSTSAESPNEYDQKKVQQIFSRWLPTAKRSTASEIASRQLSSYRDSKILLSMTLDPKDDDYWTGDTVGIRTSLVQDETGLARDINYLILQVDETISDTGVLYQYVCQAASTLRRSGVIAPNVYGNEIVFGGVNVVFNLSQVIFGGTPFPNYSDATELLRFRYIFIAPNTGVFSDNTPAYQIQ